MAEAQEVCLDQETFQRMEKNVLDQVMNTSKALLETFKFSMIYGTHVKQNKENVEALKQFRAKYAKNIGKDPAVYKKYIEMYSSEYH